MARGMRGAALAIGVLFSAPLAQAVEPDAEDRKRALVERLLNLPSVREVIALDDQRPFSSESVQISYPWLTDEEADRTVAIFAEEYARVHANAEDALFEAYVETYSEAEIRSMIRAYSDPGFVTAQKKWVDFAGYYHGVTGPAFTRADRRVLNRMRSEGLMSDEDARRYWDEVDRERERVR